MTETARYSDRCARVDRRPHHAVELRQELQTTDMASGFINRFLLVLVKRRHLLPSAVGSPAAADRTGQAVHGGGGFATAIDVLTRDAEAPPHWTITTDI